MRVGPIIIHNPLCRFASNIGDLVRTKEINKFIQHYYFAFNLLFNLRTDELKKENEMIKEGKEESEGGGKKEF